MGSSGRKWGGGGGHRARRGGGGGGVQRKRERERERNTFLFQKPNKEISFEKVLRRFG